MNQDLTKGQVMRSMLRFAVLMILENLLQQCYNIADTLIVGRCLGANALAAVGSAFTLMTFLTSILLGLCMGSGAVLSIRFGEQDEKGLIEGVYASFLRAIGNSVVPLIFLAVSAVLNIALDLWFVLGLKRGVTGEAEALKEGEIAGATCDVFETEPPLTGNHPLLHSPNTIVTPHIAFASVESMEQRAEIVFENLYSWLEGKQINCV